MDLAVDDVHGPNASPTSIARVVVITHAIRNTTAAFFLLWRAPWILIIEETVDVGTCTFFTTANTMDGLDTGTRGSGVGVLAITSIDFGMVLVVLQDGTGPGVVVVGVVAMGTTGSVSITEFLRDHIVTV